MSSPPTWAELAQRLADELAGFEDRTFLTMCWTSDPTVYVQLEQTALALVARTGDDDVLPPDQRLSPAGRSALQEDGWVVPELDPSGRRTWTCSLTWPARNEDYERLAARCVAVLRDVHAVPSPGELEYRAWREAEPDPEGVTFYPEDLEPADPHLELPGLGLRDAQDS